MLNKGKEKYLGSMIGFISLKSKAKETCLQGWTHLLVLSNDAINFGYILDMLCTVERPWTVSPSSGLTVDAAGEDEEREQEPN